MQDTYALLLENIYNKQNIMIVSLIYSKALHHLEWGPIIYPQQKLLSKSLSKWMLKVKSRVYNLHFECECVIEHTNK